MSPLPAERLLLVALDPWTGRVRSDPSSALRLAPAGSLVMDPLPRGGTQLQPGPGWSRSARWAIRCSLRRWAASQPAGGPRPWMHWGRALGDPRPAFLLGDSSSAACWRSSLAGWLGLVPDPPAHSAGCAGGDRRPSGVRPHRADSNRHARGGSAGLADQRDRAGGAGRTPREYLRDARRRANSIARGDLGGQDVSAVPRDAQAAMNAALLFNSSATAINH